MTRKLPLHFWPFAISQLISNLADGMTLLVITLLTSRLTNLSSTLGIVISALGIPWFLFSIFAIPIIDNIGAYYVIRYANFSRAFILIFLAILSYFNLLTIPILAIAAFLIGSFEVLCDNSHSVILPEIIDIKLLEKANSITTTAEVVSNKFIGVNLGSILISISIVIGLGVNSVLYLITPFLLIISKYLSKRVVFVTGFNKPEVEIKNFSIRRFFIEISYGISYIFNYKNLFLIMLIRTIWNFVFGIQQSFFVIYIKDILNFSEQFYGILISVAGLGGLVGGLVFNFIFDKFGRYNIILISIILYAGEYIIKYSFKNVYIIVIAVFLEGFADLLCSTIAVSYRQKFVPKEYQVRVATTLRLVVMGAISIGTLSGGFLAEFISYNKLGKILGILIGVGGIICLHFTQNLGEEQIF